VIHNITIIGGGTAGFMTASTLLKFFPNKKITLIESSNIPTVGVGESTILQIREWLHQLDIKDKDFVKETNATYKLSIKFTDFYQKGKSFHYPFGEAYDYGSQLGLNGWWLKKHYYNVGNEDYAESIFPNLALIKNKKLDFNEKNQLPFTFKKNSAFHFDATKFGLWLKEKYCIPKGLNYIQDDIKTIEQDKDGIKSLNNKYKADLFIDCTGFKSLLLGETFKEPFESLENLLPNNSAYATKLPYTNKKEQLNLYTNCTAYNNGWIWNIPLWNRIGTGYVYSDKFISDDDALKEFQEYLGTKELEFKKIKMRVGIHKRLWVKNVVAIGLSAGFIEPLESNGLFSIHEFLNVLLRNLHRGKVSQFDKDNFTYNCKQIFYNFADFVALHYALSHRDDTEYWKANLNKQWSNTLINHQANIVDGIDNAVRQRSFQYRFPRNAGLHCISAGMNWQPTDIYSLLKHNTHTNDGVWKLEAKNFKEFSDTNKEYWNTVVKNFPDYINFLESNFYQ
jgi:tryptophan halogenase